MKIIDLACWSRGRVNMSQFEGTEFDPHVSENCFLYPCTMYLVGYPHNKLRAEAYYYVMIDAPNDMPSDLK